MAFIDDGMSEQLKAQRDALLGITEAKEKTKEYFKDKEQITELFVETKPSDKFEIKELDQFKGLPNEFKWALESMKLTHNYPYEMSLPALLATVNFATSPLIDVHMRMFREGTIQPTNQWYMSLARSGATKSALFKEINKTITKWQKEKALAQADVEQSYEFELAVYKKNYKQIIDDKMLDDKDKARAFKNLGFQPERPAGSQHTVPTATLNALIDVLNTVPFCRIASDEASEFFHGYAMKEDNLKLTVSTMSSLFTGETIARMTGVKESNAEIHDRRFSMFFMTQPGNADFLNNAYLRRQGFLNRMLITNVPYFKLPKMASKDKVLSKKADDLMQPFHNLMLKLLNKEKIFEEGSNNLRLKPKVYDFDEDAFELITNWGDNYIEQGEPGGKLEKWQGFVSRAVEHATRTASMFTVINDKDTLDIDDVFLGMELFDFFLEQLINLEIDAPSAKFADDVQLREDFMDWFTGLFKKDNKHGKKGEMICPIGTERDMTWITNASPNFWRTHIDGTKRRAVLKELGDQNRIKARLEVSKNGHETWFFSTIEEKK